MASAAPVPAAAPQAPAGNQPGSSTAPGSAPTRADQGAASPPKKAKPIPKQMIPGVRQWATPPADDAPASETAAAEVSAPEAPVEPRFKIRDREYTQSELEKAFLSLDGRTKANARDAEAWRKYQKEQSERQPARPETVPERATQEMRDRGQEPQTKGEKKAQRWIESQGEAFWNQYRQFHEQHGPEVAAAFMADKFDSSINERIAGIEQQILARLAPALEPVLQEHVQAQNQKFADDMWTEFSTYTNDETGEPLFPELAQDPGLAKLMGRLWLGLRQEFGEKFAMKPYALYSAYRDALQYRAAEAEQGKNAGNAAQAVLDAIEHDRKAGSLTAVQAPSAPSVTAPEANPHDDTAAFKKRIREARGGFIKTGTGINLGVRSLSGREE